MLYHTTLTAWGPAPNPQICFSWSSGVTLQPREKKTLLLLFSLSSRPFSLSSLSLFLFLFPFPRRQIIQQQTKLAIAQQHYFMNWHLRAQRGSACIYTVYVSCRAVTTYGTLLPGFGGKCRQVARIVLVTSRARFARLVARLELGPFEIGTSSDEPVEYVCMCLGMDTVI